MTQADHLKSLKVKAIEGITSLLKGGGYSPLMGMEVETHSKLKPDTASPLSTEAMSEDITKATIVRNLAQQYQAKACTLGMPIIYGVEIDTGKLEMKFGPLKPMTLCRAVDSFDADMGCTLSSGSGGIARTLHQAGFSQIIRNRVSRHDGVVTSRHTTLSFIDNHGSAIMDNRLPNALINLGERMVEPLVHLIPCFVRSEEDFKRYNSKIGRTTPCHAKFGVYDPKDGSNVRYCLLLNKLLKDGKEVQWLENRLPSDVDAADTILGTLLAAQVAMENNNEELSPNQADNNLNIPKNATEALQKFQEFKSQFSELLGNAGLTAEETTELFSHYEHRIQEMINKQVLPSAR